MASTFAINAIHVGTTGRHVLGDLTVSGTYATGGEALGDTFLGVSTATTPIDVSANCAGGYNFGYDAVNNKLLVFDGASELAAGAYPAALTGNVIHLVAYFPKSV